MNFTTSRFSIFTITWTESNYSQFKVTMHYVDQNGNEINGSQSGTIAINDTTAIDLQTYANEIEGYGNPKIHRDTYNGTEIRYIKGTSSGSGKSKKYYISTSLSNGNNGFSQWLSSSKKSGDIYIVYQGPTTSAGCYSENGVMISKDKIDLLDVTEETNLADKAIKIDKYSFAYVSVVNEEKSEVAKRIRTKLTRAEGGLEYSTSEEGDVWNDVVSDEIRFVYRAVNTIPTADTSGLVDIDLYDYQNNQNIGGLLFSGSGSEKYNKWIGSWGYSGNDRYAVQGIVDRDLYDASGKKLTAEQSKDDSVQGYPKMAVGGKVY